MDASACGEEEVGGEGVGGGEGEGGGGGEDGDGGKRPRREHRKEGDREDEGAAHVVHMEREPRRHRAWIGGWHPPGGLGWTIEVERWGVGGLRVRRPRQRRGAIRRASSPSHRIRRSAWRSRTTHGLAPTSSRKACQRRHRQTRGRAPRPFAPSPPRGRSPNRRRSRRSCLRCEEEWGGVCGGRSGGRCGGRCGRLCGRRVGGG